MKKVFLRNMTSFCLLISISILLLPSNIFAQSKFQIGPTVGLGVSSMHDRTPNDKRMHFHTGLLTNFKINRKLNFQPSLLISGKGYANSLISSTESINLSYFDLISTLKYSPWKLFFVGIGTQVGYLSTARYSYGNYSSQLSGSVKINNFVYKFDYGLNGSLGCQFKSGIGLEFSVLYGLRDVFNEESDEPIYKDVYGHTYYIPEQAKGKNTVFSFSFYALFGRKPKEPVVN